MGSYMFRQKEDYQELKKRENKTKGYDGPLNVIMVLLL